MNLHDFAMKYLLNRRIVCIHPAAGRRLVSCQEENPLILVAFLRLLSAPGKQKKIGFELCHLFIKLILHDFWIRFLIFVGFLHHGLRQKFFSVLGPDQGAGFHKGHDMDGIDINR